MRKRIRRTSYALALPFAVLMLCGASRCDACGETYDPLLLPQYRADAASVYDGRYCTVVPGCHVFGSSVNVVGNCGQSGLCYEACSEYGNADPAEIGDSGVASMCLQADGQVAYGTLSDPPSVTISEPGIHEIKIRSAKEEDDGSYSPGGIIQDFMFWLCSPGDGTAHVETVWYEKYIGEAVNEGLIGSFDDASLSAYSSLVTGLAESDIADICLNSHLTSCSNDDFSGGASAWLTLFKEGLEGREDVSTGELSVPGSTDTYEARFRWASDAVAPSSFETDFPDNYCFLTGSTGSWCMNGFAKRISECCDGKKGATFAENSLPSEVYSSATSSVEVSVSERIAAARKESGSVHLIGYVCPSDLVTVYPSDAGKSDSALHARYPLFYVTSSDALTAEVGYPGGTSKSLSVVPGRETRTDPIAGQTEITASLTYGGKEYVTDPRSSSFQQTGTTVSYSTADSDGFCYVKNKPGTYKTSFDASLSLYPFGSPSDCITAEKTETSVQVKVTDVCGPAVVFKYDPIALYEGEAFVLSDWCRAVDDSGETPDVTYTLEWNNERDSAVLTVTAVDSAGNTTVAVRTVGVCGEEPSWWESHVNAFFWKIRKAWTE